MKRGLMNSKVWAVLAAVVLISAVPLWLVAGAPFGGADDVARAAIGTLKPGYQPWFAPLIEPASGEVASLLFALQAAVGAGVIGYWLGISTARARHAKEHDAD